MANNGRQPKHPINLTGPDLKPRGVLNSLTPNADAGATLTLRYTLTEKGAMPCAIAGRYGEEGVAKGWQRGGSGCAQDGGSMRWRRGGREGR